LTLLEMLDVLEAGCITLQQRSGELAAALSQAGTQAGTNVIASPLVEPTPKRRAPAKRKPKASKIRSKRKTAASKKKGQLPLALAATADGNPSVETEPKNNEEGVNRGKRQALGMSFSKLRAAIQARRGERRGEEDHQH
jgi:hypothetical protein